MFAGLSAPFRAIHVIWRTPGAWRYVLAPVLINIVLGALLYLGLVWGGLRAIDGWVAGLPEWAQGIAALLNVLLIVALFLLIGFVLVRFGVVLGSPFYGKLSELLEQQLSGHAPPAEPLTIAGIARDLSRALAFELKKLLLSLAGLGAVLVLGLVPLAGPTLAIILQIAVSALIACLDFLDGPLERRRLRFRSKLNAIRRGLPATVGFGLVCFALVSIPLLNLLCIPVCVAAGTLLFCERIQTKL